MAKQLINLGTAVNDGTGDALRVGAQKINDNFSELYTYLGDTSGQLSLVSSIIPGDAIQVNANSGNVVISAKVATATEVGVVKVGSGLEISEGGVLSATIQEQFSGSYNDLTNTPDLSVYQLSSAAFSGDYNDLINAPPLPETLFDLGIAPGSPVHVLVTGPSGDLTFSTLFDQEVFTTSDVLFNSISSNTTLTLNTDTTVTQDLILSLTAQRDNLQNTVLPSLEQQFDAAQSNYNYWMSILNSTMPGSPQWLEAQSQVGFYQNQMGSINTQIGITQGQISTLNSQIGYYQNILSSTSTTVHFDHPTQTVVFTSTIQSPSITLPNSNTITTPAGIRINSAEDLMILANGSGWTFGSNGQLTLPVTGRIASDGNIELSGDQRVAVIGTPFRLANLTREERNAFNDPFPLNGSMIYNTTEHRYQIIQNGVINTLPTVIIHDPLSSIPQDLSECGVKDVDAWSKDGLYEKSYTFYGSTNEVGSTDVDTVYFAYDLTKYSGGVLEFEAEDIQTDLESPTVVYNRYIGTAKFSHFNNGITDSFVFKVDVDDVLNDSNFNFGASIGVETINSSQGPVECVVLRFRQLVTNPRTDSGNVQIGIKWKATMFSAVAETEVLYVGVGGPI